MIYRTMLSILISVVLIMHSTHSSWVINGDNPRINIVGGTNQGWKQSTYPLIFGYTRGAEGGVIIPSRGELRQITLCAYDGQRGAGLTEAVVLTPTINGVKTANAYDIEIRPSGENHKVICFQYGLPVSSGDQFNLVSNTTNTNMKSATVVASL